MKVQHATSGPIVLERTFNASTEEVWDAITDKEKMKEWYFDIKEFKATVGFEFQFYAGDDKRQYLHLCQVTAVIPGRKLSYTWKYDHDSCVTLVTFELFPEGKKTRLKLTHEGTENFSTDHPELDRKNFVSGWDAIINNSLCTFLEK